jgi:Putative peptidoglycan-binding domain-containing protein
MSDLVLSLGDRNESVSILQQALIEQGFDCGDDSFSQVFGPATEAAVKLFQASHIGPLKGNLDVDGNVGPATWWALRHPSGEAQHQAPFVDAMPVQKASNPIAEAALASAFAELHLEVVESPDGSNRGAEIDLYTGMVGKPITMIGPPWCAYFVSWNFAKSPGGSPFGRIGGAQSIALYCQRNIPGSVSAVRSAFSPRCGDIGVIANGQVHGHAVQVAAVQDAALWTVEGNSGNAVRTKKRAIDTFRYFVNFDAYAKLKGLPVAPKIEY